MESVSLVGIDLAKHVFHIHGIDANGRPVIQKQLRRPQLMRWAAQLPATTIAMEACSGAHFWGRQFMEFGHQVRLISAQYVKAFVRGQKNDRNDAEAICEAASRPSIRIVAVKSADQQQILALHRVRDLLVKQRTASVNQLRGLLAEFGVIIPQGRRAVMAALPDILEDASNQIPPMMRALAAEQRERLLELDGRIADASQRIEQLARSNAVIRDLTKLRGVGPLVATAFVADVGDPRAFRNGRQVGAWLGLVPRQHSSGGKTRLSHITRRGDPYLRSLLVHGARAVVRTAARHDDSLSKWILEVESRRGRNRAVVAVANKLARHLWATWRYSMVA
jgi:transposase